MHPLTGSGKTTLVKAITKSHPNFHRISIDEIIFTKHGIYGIDYPASYDVYEQYSTEADAIYLDTFQDLLKAGENIVLERSFYANSDRDEFRKIVEEAGARLVLVYLKALDKETLWQRICWRAEGDKDANSALAITRELFDMYWDGFEGPEGEGEVVFEVCPRV